jgi:hypothetical protein
MLPLLAAFTATLALAAEPHPPLRVGLLPDTQGGGYNVAIHPMQAVLAKLSDEQVNLVIAVGDLTDNGSPHEFDQWTQTARPFRDQGIEFLPLMGNHEDSFAYTVQWIDAMKEFIPADAVHMRGAQYLNYYVIRGNVMLIALRYYHLPVAFRWLRQAVEHHRAQVDHIVIASHDGLIGAKYGQTRETIVEGSRGNDLLADHWDEIRHFFAEHDVIWVQGHEHMYQRSVIQAPLHLQTQSWSPADGNYRMPAYTQIISGNASYKGYEFRYGEREKVQAIIQHKMNTLQEGSEAFDANASILSFRADRVDFQSWFVNHTVKHNDDGPRELAAPQWQLMDKFSRTRNRCERLVYANSIPPDTRPVMTLDPYYRTNDCHAPDGSVARLIDGINDTFNRVDSTAETLSWREGFSRATSQNDLMRLAYQYLFVRHQPWTPNLNGRQRMVADSENPAIVHVPATTIDMKEHLTLSWSPAEHGTLSDVLIISGTQQQTGTYSSAFGAVKDLTRDSGLPGSQPDGTAKQPHTLPPGASKNWDLPSAVSDAYVVQFDASAAASSGAVPGYKDAEGNWHELSSAACVMIRAYAEELLLHTQQQSDCDAHALVGKDPAHPARWWAVLYQDIELALIPVRD